MKTMFFESTEDSPHILLEVPSHKLVIKGRSFMSDVMPFQQAIIDKLRLDFADSKQKLSVIIELEYLNLNSHNMFFYIMAELNKYYIFGKPIEISWTYYADDEYMKDVIAEFRELFDMPITEMQLS